MFLTDLFVLQFSPVIIPSFHKGQLLDRSTRLAVLNQMLDISI